MGLNNISLKLEKQYGLCLIDRIEIKISGGSCVERSRIIKLAETALLNSWQTELEETEGEAQTG